MSPKPLAYSYVRWSSAAQKLGDSERRQAERSRQYAADHGYHLIEEMTDSGISAFRGRNATEGALAGFLKAVEGGKIPAGSFLLVESLDRLSRQEVRKSLALFLQIINAGINIVTLADTERVYTPEKCDAMDLMQSIMIMSRANEEVRLKSYRVGKAWADKRNNAATAKLTRMCPGWLKLSEDRKTFDKIKDRVKIIQSIFEDSAAGIGDYLIARRFNARNIPTFGTARGWEQSYIAKVLVNRVVLGDYQPHRVVNKKRTPEGNVVKNYYPPIIPDELFYRVQAARKQRRLIGAGRKGEHISNLFSGLLKCCYCNSTMKFENKGKKGTYLVCDGAQRGMACERKRWRYSDFESSFIEFVKDIDFSTIVKSGVDHQTRLNLENRLVALQGEHATIEAKQEAAFELLDKAKVDFVQRKLQELQQQSVDVVAKIAATQTELEALNRDSKGFNESRDNIKALLNKLNGEFKIRAEASSRIKSLVETIYIAPLGYRNDLLSFLTGDNRKFVVYWLKQARNRFFVVHFKNTDKLLFVSWHPDNAQWTKIFSFTPYEK